MSPRQSSATSTSSGRSDSSRLGAGAGHQVVNSRAAFSGDSPTSGGGESPQKAEKGGCFLVHLPINTVAFERLCIPARGVPRLRRGRNWDSSVAHVPSRYAALFAVGEPGRSDALGARRISGGEHLAVGSMR